MAKMKKNADRRRVAIAQFGAEKDSVTDHINNDVNEVLDYPHPPGGDETDLNENIQAKSNFDDIELSDQEGAANHQSNITQRKSEAEAVARPPPKKPGKGSTTKELSKLNKPAKHNARMLKREAALYSDGDNNATPRQKTHFKLSKDEYLDDTGLCVEDDATSVDDMNPAGPAEDMLSAEEVLSQWYEDNGVVDDRYVDDALERGWYKDEEPPFTLEFPHRMKTANRARVCEAKKLPPLRHYLEDISSLVHYGMTRNELQNYDEQKWDKAWRKCDADFANVWCPVGVVRQRTKPKKYSRK